MRTNKREGRGMNKGHKGGLKVDDLCRGVWRYARSAGAGLCVSPVVDGGDCPGFTGEAVESGLSPEQAYWTPLLTCLSAPQPCPQRPNCAFPPYQQ